MKRLVLIPILLLSYSVLCQSLQEILDQARTVLSTQEYAMDITYTQELRGASGIEKTFNKSKFRRFNDGYVQSIGDQIIQVQEDGVLLTVDKEEKLISMDYSSGEAFYTGGIDLDMFNNEYFTTKLDSSADDVHKITIISKGEYATMKELEVHYSKVNYYPQKIIILYPENESETENQVISQVIDYHNIINLEGRSSSDLIQHFVKIQEDNFEILLSEYKLFDKFYHL